jgi:hypothetical protein
MQAGQQAQAPFFSLLFAWATQRLSVRLSAMKPKLTAEEAAAAVAVSGNPSGT